MARDYETAPVAERLGLEVLIRKLSGDLDSLRNGEITVQDAMARAALAKQVFNGVRLYLNGMKVISEAAMDVTPQAHAVEDGEPR